MACGVRKCLEILSKYEADKNVPPSSITGNDSFETDSNKEVSDFLTATAKILNQFGDNLKDGADINLSGLDIKSICHKCNSLTGVALELCRILEEFAETMTRAVSSFKPKGSSCAKALVSVTDVIPTKKADDQAEIKKEGTNIDLLTEDSQTNSETQANEIPKNFNINSIDHRKDNDESVRETKEIDSYHSCFDTGYVGGSVNGEDAYLHNQLSEDGLPFEHSNVDEHCSWKSHSGREGDSTPEVPGQMFVRYKTSEMATAPDSSQDRHGQDTDITGEEMAATESSPEAHKVVSETDATGEEATATNYVENVMALHEADKKCEGDVTIKAEDATEEKTLKDEVLFSDTEYDSLTTTEDEGAPEATIPEEMNDCQDLLELSAVRMFKKHMEKDGIDIDIFPTPRENPTKQTYYTCRVMDFKAIGCGRSKKAAKRDALSKMVRLIIKSHEDGMLPKEISPFSSEELSALEDVQIGGDDYLSQLRDLCESEDAPPPVFQVQFARGTVGEKVFSVQCTALSRTAVGTSTRKKAAKRRAAREVIKRHEEERASGATSADA